MAGAPTLIASVQRALHLLDVVGSSARPLTAKALARATGEKLPTTYHLLATLVHEGYLVRLDGVYVLGDHVSALSGRLEPERLRERVRPILSGLHDTLRAAAYLVLYRDGELELVDIVDSPSRPRVDLWVNLASSGHATALGKAVLSALDEEGRRDYLSRHTLADLTPYTLTDRQSLLRGLSRGDSTPEGGRVVVDVEEYSLGIACLATPVRVMDPNSGVSVAALAVSVAAPALEGTRRRSASLTRAAEHLALDLAV